MKPGFSSPPTDAESARARARFDTSAGKRVLQQARAQLNKAVDEALTGSLEALGERLHKNRLLAPVGLTAQAHAHRLREVVERDRALIASSPESDRAPPEGEQEQEPVPGEPAEASSAHDAAPTAREELASVVTSRTGVAPAPAALCKEPIRTRTMAKLLAAQGHRQRALSIYDDLLANNASEPGLEAEANALRKPPE